MGVLFCRGVQGNLLIGETWGITLPISVSESHRNCEGIHFPPKFRIYLHIILTTKHKKDFEQNTHYIPFSVALFFLFFFLKNKKQTNNNKKNQNSLQGWGRAQQLLTVWLFQKTKVKSQFPCQASPNHM